RELRPGDIAAIHERHLPANSADSAPGPFADERTQLVLFEEIAKEIAIGCRVVICDAHHGPVKNVGWQGAAFKVAGRLHPCQDAAQPLKNQLTHETPAVVADVKNNSLLADLREVLFDELIQAGRAHVRQVNITDLAASGRLNFLAVRGDHVQLAK